MFNVSGERESNTKKSKTIYFQLITLIISDVVSEKGNNSKGSSLLIINTLAGYLYLLRRGRDSNPRYPFEVYTLSRRALSTTQTPLREMECKCKINFELQMPPVPILY